MLLRKLADAVTAFVGCTDTVNANPATLSKCGADKLLLSLLAESKLSWSRSAVSSLSLMTAPYEIRENFPSKQMLLACTVLCIACVMLQLGSIATWLDTSGVMEVASIGLLLRTDWTFGC